MVPGTLRVPSFARIESCRTDAAKVERPLGVTAHRVCLLLGTAYYTEFGYDFAMSADERAYHELLRHLREMALVESTLEVLAWDELTLMPDSATEHRGAQLAHLAGAHHALAASPRIDEWLAAVEASPLVTDPHSAAAVNIREARRQHQRLSRQPRSLVEELARVTTAAQHEWKLARAASDYKHFEPWLAAVVTLKREQALCLADDGPLYDPLLAEYEAGLRTADVAAILEVLRSELTALVPEVLAMQASSATAASP